MAGLFSIGAVAVDRRLTRRHDRRAALRAAVNELTATASVLPLGVEAETLRRDSGAVATQLVTGLDRMLIAHGTVDLLGSEELRVSSHRLIEAVGDCIQATTSTVGWWPLLTRRAHKDKGDALTTLSTAIQSFKSTAKRHVD